MYASTTVLLIVLVFSMVVRGIVHGAGGALGLTPYYADALGQIVMYASMTLAAVHQLGLAYRKAFDFHGRAGTLAPDLVAGLGVGVALLALTFAESASITWVIAQVDAAQAYRLGKYHPAAYPAHPALSVHVATFVVANVVVPAVVEEVYFRVLLFGSLCARFGIHKAAFACRFSLRRCTSASPFC